MKVFKCSKCNHVCDSKYVCYRCKQNDQVLLVDTDEVVSKRRYEKLKALTGYSKVETLIKKISGRVSCTNCPVTERCSIDLTNTYTSKECEEQITEWWNDESC